MKAHGKQVLNKVRVHTNCLMGTSLPETLATTCRTATASLSKAKSKHKARSKTVSLREKVNSSSKTALNMWEPSLKVNFQKEKLKHQTELHYLKETL